MHADARQNGLRQALDSMVDLESGLERSLALASAATKGYLDAPAIIEWLQAVVAGWRKTLEAHIGALGEMDVPPIGPGMVALLTSLAAPFTRAALAYAVLHAVAHHSWMAARPARESTVG